MSPTRLPPLAALLLALLHVPAGGTVDITKMKSTTSIPIMESTPKPPQFPFEKIIAQVGAVGVLKCNVGLNTTAKWYKLNEDYSDRTILTSGNKTEAKDQRYYADVEDKKDQNMSTWILTIRYVQVTDQGYYQCQHPVSVKNNSSVRTFFKLTLIIARAEILGGDKEVTTGAPLRLSCILRHNIVDADYIFWYYRDLALNYDRVLNYERFNGSIRAGRRGSELIIPKVQPTQGGNYTCVPSNALQDSVMITVIPTVT